MTKMTQSYWIKIEKEKLNKYKADTEKIERELTREYKKTYEQIVKEIEQLFGKYAKDNKISTLITDKLLTKNQLKEFRKDLKEYIEEIKDYSNTKLIFELKELSKRIDISVLDEKIYQVDKYINKLYQTSYNANTELFKATLSEGYYRQTYDIHKFVGVGVAFSLLNSKSIKDILNKKWSGANYSTRTWNNCSKIKFIVRETITRMIGQSLGVTEISKEVKERMNTDLSNYKRLIQTEHAYFVEQGSKMAYEELGVDEYEYLATLDSRTSPTCRSLDGKIFKVSEAMQGVNYPPVHCHCRSTTIPHIGKDFGSRFARDKSTRGIQVPATMKYNEWKSEFGVEY